MKLIPLDALVAEIERIQKNLNLDDCGGRSVMAWSEGFKNFLDTLEVKEVDLEKEINKYISDNFFGSETMGFFAARTKEEPNDIDMALCAKHFFKLGVNASNPLTWEDIKLIWNITDEMDNMPEEEFYKEVLKRFKEKKRK
jgi:hypothetical protein